MFIRALIFFFGLLMLSTGISVITHAGLGTGTISSVALVLSKALPLSMGFFVFLTNVFFFVLKTSIVDGRRAGFTAAAGVFTGDAVLVFLAYLGIAALVLAHPEVFFWLKILGAAYLAWLGGKAIHATFFAKKAEKAEGESEVVVKKSRSLVKVYRNALALSLTNPKSILFYVSFFVQFIDPAFDNPAISYTILALILECFSMAWMTLLITAGADLLKFFGRRPSVAKLGNTAMGSMFLLFASKLALDA